jgi:hypothetical protein
MFHPPLRPLALSGLLLTAIPALRAATTVTVRNLTGQTLAVSRPWHPWRPEPDDPPLSYPAFRRWLRPLGTATYQFQLPGRDQEVDLVVRRLATGEAIHHDGLVIQALDPDLEPAFHGPGPAMPDPDWARVIGEDLPPEPEAADSVPR